MKTTLTPTFFVLLTLALGTNAIAATPVDAPAPVNATAEQANTTDSANHQVPSIVDEEDIPAYLRVDPCDTEDS